MRRLPTRIGVLLLLVASAAACKGKKQSPSRRDVADDAAVEMSRDEHPPETVLVTELAIQRVDPAQPVEVDDNLLARELGAMLAESQPFAATTEDVPAGRRAVPARVVATVTYDVAEDATGARGVVVAIELTLDWQSGERLTPSENVLVERPFAAGDKRETVVPDVIEAALLQAGKGLIEKEALRQADDAAVLAALDDADLDRVSWALDLVGDRRIAAGFDRSIVLLDSGDEAVRTAAMRALVALRDPRAVEPLAKRADFKDPARLRTIIEVVSAIGGDEAAEFLELVATGHSDPDLRQRAAEGLARLKK